MSALARIALLLMAGTSIAGQGGAARMSTASDAFVFGGSGAVSGVVVDGSTKEPIAGAIVALIMPGPNGTGAQTRQLTDAKGRFVFVNLPDNTYTLAANLFGYFDGGFGRESAHGGPLSVVTVRDAAWLPDLRVTLWRPSSISGVVTDEAGEPMVGISVRAIQQIRIHGRNELAAGPIATTDDRGAYRIAGLASGSYLVHVPSVQTTQPGLNSLRIAVAGSGSAVIAGTSPWPPPPDNDRPRAYSMMFYPSARVVTDAAVIDLQPGEQRSGVDVRAEPVLTSRVSGVVEGPATAFAHLTLRLIAPGLESLSNSTDTALTGVAPDGRFSFLNVPAGTYTISSSRATSEFVASAGGGRVPPNYLPPPGRTMGVTMLLAVTAGPPGTAIAVRRSVETPTMNYFGRTTVTVGDRDETGVVVRLRPGGTMTGHVDVETDPAFGPGRLVSPGTGLILEPASGNVMLGFLTGDYRPEAPPEEFSIDGLDEGEYFMRTAGTRWIIRSVTWQGRDYTTTPFDAVATRDFTGVRVSLTNRVPVITGVVRSRSGTAAAGAAVIAFPADRTKWVRFGLVPSFIRSVLSTNDGAFELVGLPAGDYRVAAVEGSLALAWQTPGFLAKVEALASTVTLRWGEKTSIDLAMQEVRR